MIININNPTGGVFSRMSARGVSSTKVLNRMPSDANRLTSVVLVFGFWLLFLLIFVQDNLHHKGYDKAQATTQQEVHPHVEVIDVDAHEVTHDGCNAESGQSAAPTQSGDFIVGCLPLGGFQQLLCQLCGGTAAYEFHA